MKRKKSILKMVACILVLSLSLTILQPISVFAEQNISSSETTQEKWVPSEEDMRLPNTKGDLTLEQLETAKLLPEDTPEIVSQDSIEENGHVNRLWEQEEDLNTVVFQNRDGTKTAYHYSDPVKYTDKNGKVKDKKNKLSETTNGEYTNAENDINAYFPKKLHKNKGVELKFGEYVFEMSPNINGSSGASRQTGHDKDSNPTEYVEYPEVFADDISLRYTPTFGGYKEDIILAKNTGINRFEFKLTTNGLSLVQASTGNYYLSEPLTGEYVTALGNVIVYDNTGVESEGYNHYYEVTTISQDEQYLITVIVDEHYLESKDTAYPVYVDPTLTVMPQGDVEDAVLYSDDSETAYSGLIKIGYDAAYGTGRGLYDFPIFNFTNDFILMYGNQIKSAELNLYAQIQGSDRDNAKNLSLYEFHSDWSPSTVKWSNTDPDNYDTLVSSKSVTTGWTAFNILPVIEKFKSDSDYAMAFKGLLLKANSETYTTWKKFVSSLHPTLSNQRPYIQITYNDSPTACSQVVSGATYYLKNYNGDYLDVYNGNTSDNTRLLTYAFHGDANQQFKITNVFGGEYEIAPQHTTGKVLSVNSSGQVIIEEDCNLSRQRWYIYYKNGDYHIVNKHYNTGVMGATYDTDYVSINDEYEYCCWELELPEGIRETHLFKFDYEIGLNIFDPIHYDNLTVTHFNNNTAYAWVDGQNSFGPAVINNDLKLALENLERAYQEGNRTQIVVDVHHAHTVAENILSDYPDVQITVGSTDYYALWATCVSLVATVQIDAIQTIENVATFCVIVYHIARPLYKKFMASRYSKMSAGSRQVVSKDELVSEMHSTYALDYNIDDIAYTNKTYTTAEARNSTLKLKNPPYKPTTSVIGYKTTETTQYVRVYNPTAAENASQMQGKWVVKYSDIQGLTPTQIRNKLALPNIPTHICDVYVPANTQMYTGFANGVQNWGTGGGIQFELGELLSDECFINGRLLS